MSIVLDEYANSDALVSAFSHKLASILKQSISQKGSASIAVSGGSTPKPLFQALSQISLPWNKVYITLADDRWVDATHEASNEKLVKENLMINEASAANFVSLVTDDGDAKNAESTIAKRIQSIDFPLDIVILGMGEDGHTASLFPCSEQIQEGLNLQRKLPVIATQPTSAPHQRMSLSLASIVASPHIFLHITGDKKRAVLETALANHSAIEKPIKAVCDNSTVNLVWAP
ncbi:6-phosphogluconolactonase [Glaciecola sp. XM2]|uniref:6-phosphogluconolactonase n=1 Tax=Glaciecola sp. XM2 TaxID=1914931 RepID=UPI001BDE3893|nr:6-phosphogluconolactonase [Glaciecola sp. XM2]MBT1449382.1 6-phosphogluconolactonase [Glaciecola sp. XM2]